MKQKTRLGELAIFLLFSGAVHAEGVVDPDSTARAIVTWADAGAPLGKFLLVRKDKDFCALRFTEYHRGNDAKPPTFFNSGEESFYAEYDWFYRGTDSGDATKQSMQSGHGKVAKKALIGIGRLAFQTGNIEVECGPLTLTWMYPTRVSFFIGGRIGNYGIELAPTKWADIGQVDFQNMNLKWYRSDENRKVTYIPLEQLP